VSEAPACAHSAAVHVRRATTADAAEIARLGAQFAHPAPPAEISACIRDLRAQPAYLLAVAEESPAQLLGWIQVERRVIVAEARERAEIMGLVVDAAARRRGVGTLLVTAAQQWARDQLLGEILVRSNVVRDASHRFYVELGFSRVKTSHVYAKTLVP
jgi:GNAT superfamily N-acetyltransferase